MTLPATSFRPQKALRSHHIGSALKLTQSTPLRDVLRHPTLSETSKDSAAHHFCPILLSPLWAPLLCKATKPHYQLASGQMITKASTHLTQATADVVLSGMAAQEIFGHLIPTPNNHPAKCFQC